MLMIRGVSWALDNWIARSTADVTSTTIEKSDAAVILRILRALSLEICASNPKIRSMRFTRAAAITPANTHSAGKSQKELRTYSRSLYRFSQDISDLRKHFLLAERWSFYSLCLFC